MIEQRETLERARELSAEFADWMQGIAEQPFNFDGPNPNKHSYHNHQHLSLLEGMADRHKSIDLAFRCRVVAYIFGRWAVRLRSYGPYQTQGYRFYLYEDLAPTVSVVAETPQGFSSLRRLRSCNSMSAVPGRGSSRLRSRKIHTCSIQLNRRTARSGAQPPIDLG